MPPNVMSLMSLMSENQLIEKSHPATIIVAPSRSPLVPYCMLRSCRWNVPHLSYNKEALFMGESDLFIHREPVFDITSV